MPSIIQVKYAVPTKFMTAPYGTICRVMKDDNELELYIQISPEESIPMWEKLGNLFEKAFEDFLVNDEFVQDCLRLYKVKEISSFSSINKIIKEQ